MPGMFLRTSCCLFAGVTYRVLYGTSFDDVTEKQLENRWEAWCYAFTVWGMYLWLVILFLEWHNVPKWYIKNDPEGELFLKITQIRKQEKEGVWREGINIHHRRHKYILCCFKCDLCTCPPYNKTANGHSVLKCTFKGKRHYCVNAFKSIISHISQPLLNTDVSNWVL